jgi:16S rRNA (cytidine1402-2'-O)-methyltransferase
MGAVPSGTLWIVATPIGNLEDLPPRAVSVLRAVALVACEDTRHSAGLFARFGIGTPTLPLHEHNEREAAERVLARLVAGESVALVSDAGTPLVSDPGYRLVMAAREAGVRVSTVPGPCALVAALSISGLPTDRFCFEGFLPPKSAARRARLEALAVDPRTLVFYESKHRIVECLQDLAATLGPQRRATLARELTKMHETVLAGTLDELHARVGADPERQLGEFVVVVAGAPDDADAARMREGERVLRLLLDELPGSRAAKLAAAITGAPRNALYRLATGEDT